MVMLVKRVLVAVLLLTNVFCREMDVNYWTEGIEEVRLIFYHLRIRKTHFHTNILGIKSIFCHSQMIYLTQLQLEIKYKFTER